MNIIYFIFNKIGKLFLKIGNVLVSFGRVSQKVDQRIVSVINTWFQDKGDETLRLDYDLNEDSVVFDIGGYKGDWAAGIFLKYMCNVSVFEPVPIFAESIKKRFSPNPKIKIYAMGFGPGTTEVLMSVIKDGSSLYRPGDIRVSALIKNASDFFNEQNIKYIDLMKINIEGGEYDLLDHLISSGFVTSIRNIQVQFHTDFPDAEQRMINIQQKLSQTHSLTYQYRFVWENWKLN